MIPLVTAGEMRAAERAAMSAGVSERVLMRRAAEKITQWLGQAIPAQPNTTRNAIALVGPGNNGGDALVTLALLVERGWSCVAILIDRDSLGALPARDELLYEIRVGSAGAILHADVVLDGIYGIGGRSELPSLAAEVIAAAHSARTMRGTPLIAIDVPSGVDPTSGRATEQAFRADATLCLGLPKLGLTHEPAASFAGELVVLDIGIVAPAVDQSRPHLLDEAGARQVLPRRKAGAHKSNSGSVLVVGGAPNYYGAPRLAADMAARAGAGLACLVVPRMIVPSIAAQLPEATYLPLDERDGDANASAISAYLDESGGRYTAAVVGPGLGRARPAMALLERVFAPQDPRHPMAKLPMVIDADALNWLASLPDWRAPLAGLRTILTPHPGEMARLMRVNVDDVLADQPGAARRAALESGCVIVLKTGYSVVASPNGDVFVAPRAMPEYATAGTGDVLAGLIGGLLAQGLEPLDAAKLAMFAGAMAGRRARQEVGTAQVVARDVIGYIAAELRRLSEPRLNPW